MAMISSVLLDFDGTLHDLDSKMRYRFEKLHPYVGISPCECMEAYRRMKHEYESGKTDIGRDPLTESLLRHMGLRMTLEEFKKLWNTTDDYWQNGGSLYEDALPLLSGLQSMGMKTYLFTNGSRSRREADLKAIGIEKYFAGVFGAREAGKIKTDDDFVAEIIKEVEPGKSAVIGDSLRDDVGMKRFGFRAVWLNRNGSGRHGRKYEPDYTARDLYDALGYIRSVNGGTS